MEKYKFEIFNRNKKYISTVGGLMGVSDIEREKAGILQVSAMMEDNPCIVKTDSTGFIYKEMELLSRWKDWTVDRATTLLGMKEEDIDFGETVEDALAKITEILNTPEPAVVSSHERQVAATEFNNLLQMQLNNLLQKLLQKEGN